ncbi:MAG: hypothetical protein IPO92_01540 [Saprospiraceae bacterium]|nr:hypothetical protein [Saprospiraceae bacterium]
MVSEKKLTLLKLSHQSTKTEMSEFSKAIAMDQGIIMDFSTSEFFEDGKLRKLKLTVILPDNTGGKTSADLTTLQFKYYGFQYQKNGNPIFKIGLM